MKYEILDVDALGRIGKLEVNKKQMITPNLFPVIHPFKNIIPSSDFKNFGAQSVFTNAYILYQNETVKENVLKKKIHQFLEFDGLIATDSGAFQQYMYNSSNMKIKAEEIEGFQEKIESDFPVILDIPLQPDDTYEMAMNKVDATIDRARENIKRRSNENCVWFGPIHGGKYHDLLTRCINEMNNLDFGVYAIGGLVKLFIDYRFDVAIQILLNVKKSIKPNKPLHMFGLGLPQFFSLAVACGCDLMDSAAYILYAKKNRYFTLSTGTKNLEDLEEFPCHCPICTKFSPNELKKFEDKLRIKLIAEHNLYLSFSELKTIRQAIREGNLWDLVEQRIRAHPNLVKAARILKKDYPTFELYEKIYKKHGRKFVSYENIYRPLISRYENKINNNYRVPMDVKFLMILPELDARGENSPTIQNWLEEINNNAIIPRKDLHIVFNSFYFGLIPLELIKTYPMGQFESITASEEHNELYESSVKKSNAFIIQNHKKYDKCGVLIPEKYINQFNEVVEFNAVNPIRGLEPILKSKFQSKYSVFTNLNDLLQFFRAE
ncbi:MAG: tRNA guanosine(15) transglycosylase TgtA [Candidatus Lokiarchaeota archaeon]|nr:tRNA guanosine(15) transglycosylase TgtA [Candidatus Lokiarchaeota archaeon]